MQNRTFLVLLRPIFGEKLKTAPPKGNWVPKLWSTCRDSAWKSVRISDFGRKISHNFGEDFFFFLDLFFLWRAPVFGLKKRLNFRFWPENQSQFRWRPFFCFVLESTCFWAKKTFEFPILAGKSVTISVKTFFLFCFGDHLFLGWQTFEFSSFPKNSVSIFGQTVWFWFKSNVNSGQGRLHFSHSFKKAPPPFPKSWLRAWL